MPVHTPRRRFGQHFLHDPQILTRIVAAIQPSPDDRLLEIGPGQGALTRPLLAAVTHLHVVEIDRDLIPGLQALAPPERLTIHAQDILGFSLDSAGPGPWRVVGNLPYNISTPLLFHLLAQAQRIQDMHFLLQREVVERLVAAPGGKDYGRLSVMLQAQAQAMSLLRVSPGAFTPPPKVDSAVVRIRPHAQPLVSARLAPVFARIVAQAFANRRKTLRKALTGLLSTAAIQQAGIDDALRAERLSVQDFIALAMQLAP